MPNRGPIYTRSDGRNLRGGRWRIHSSLRLRIEHCNFRIRVIEEKEWVCKFFGSWHSIGNLSDVRKPRGGDAVLNTEDRVFVCMRIKVFKDFNHSEIMMEIRVRMHAWLSVDSLAGTEIVEWKGIYIWSEDAHFLGLAMTVCAMVAYAIGLKSSGIPWNLCNSVNMLRAKRNKAIKEDREFYLTWNIAWSLLVISVSVDPMTSWLIRFIVAPVFHKAKTSTST